MTYHVTQNTMECLGGPLDGAYRSLYRGEREYVYVGSFGRHKYLVQSQDDGMYLVYQGLARG